MTRTLRSSAWRSNANGHEVGEDHIVELLVSDEALAGVDDELELRMARAGELDHPAR